MGVEKLAAPGSVSYCSPFLYIQYVLYILRSTLHEHYTESPRLKLSSPSVTLLSQFQLRSTEEEQGAPCREGFYVKLSRLLDETFQSIAQTLPEDDCHYRQSADSLYAPLRRIFAGQ